VDNKDPNIKFQDALYRRGMLLGLTMAEIMVLVLFALLLALTAAIAKRENQIAEKDRKIETLKTVEREIEKILEVNPEGVTVNDIIQQITRNDETISKLKKELDRAKPFEEQAKIIDDIIKELKRGGAETPSASDVAEKLKNLQKLQKENITLKGQNKQLSRQIKKSGRGNEFPSCWVTPDGKTESVFEIEIQPGGILVADRDQPHRVEDKVELPLNGIQYDMALSLREFQTQLRPLYRWSVEHKCRFYVIIFSSDANVRTDFVNAVNGFFYPDSRIQLRKSKDKQ